MQKECSSCGKLRTYKNKKSYKVAVETNSKCQSCTNKNAGKYEGIPYSWYNAKKSQSVYRELTWNITIEHIWSLYVEQDGLCALSGLPIGWGKEVRATGHTVSIDRIDSSIGYEPDNIQLVHKVCNSMKNDLSMDEFLNFIKHISQWNGLHN